MKSEIQSFAIIPAAGRSTRMGQAKLLMPWGEKTLIEHTIGIWQASRATRAIVVVAPEDEQLAEVCRTAGAEVVVPAVRPPEMKDSVAVGIDYAARRYSPTAADVWLLAPADMPGLSPAIIDRLLAEHDADRPAILAPLVAGRRAHPVLLPWPLAAEVQALADDEGINSIVERHTVRTIACDDIGLLSDIDTPADYRRLQNRHKPNG